MKKILYVIISVICCISVCPLFVNAAKQDPKFAFELSVDGKDVKEVQTGDVVTVSLMLKRTDMNEKYMMYAMQDEIRYDSTFFELVEGSQILNTGINTVDIAMVDCFRELYMNFLSMSGGVQWNPDMLIGSFQLKVIGKSGVTHITNEDYLVSLENGEGSYSCEANAVKVILSTECNVKFHCNGGTEIPEQKVQYGEKIVKPENPIREGYSLEGWYTDIDLTDEWNFDNEVEENMSLYAKWEEMNAQTESSLQNNRIIAVILVISFVMLGVILKKKNKR